MDRKLGRLIGMAGLVAVAGCSTATHVRGHDGQPEVLIECGAATPLSVCYKRAEKECADGYKTVSEESGLNRQVLRIECRS